MDIQRISNMDALLFALALEVVLLQMRILEGCTELCAQQGLSTDEIGKIQGEKLARDREMLHNVIRRTLIEMAETGKWHTLQEAANFLNQRALSANTKRQYYKELRSKCQQISEELSAKKIQCEIQLRFMDQKIAHLMDKINDDLLNANARLSYTEKWLLARAETQELEYKVKNDIVSIRRTEFEKRVHEEIIKAYELQIKEREDSLEYWQQRFSIDTTRINQNLSKICDQLRVVDNRRKDLQTLYNLHAGEIRAWLTFKRERAARLAREARVRASATRIQSWWRGIMVRRAIGAYRFLKNTKKSIAKPKKK